METLAGKCLEERYSLGPKTLSPVSVVTGNIRADLTETISCFGKGKHLNAEHEDSGFFERKFNVQHEY